jgi:hypothetical protein
MDADGPLRHLRAKLEPNPIAATAVGSCEMVVMEWVTAPDYPLEIFHTQPPLTTHAQRPTPFAFYHPSRWLAAWR